MLNSTIVSFMWKKCHFAYFIEHFLSWVPRDPFHAGKLQKYECIWGLIEVYGIGFFQTSSERYLLIIIFIVNCAPKKEYRWYIHGFQCSYLIGGKLVFLFLHENNQLKHTQESFRILITKNKKFYN